MRNCAACGHPTEQNNRLGIGTCCTEGESYDPTGARIAGYYDRTPEGDHYTEDGPR